MTQEEKILYQEMEKFMGQPIQDKEIVDSINEAINNAEVRMINYSKDDYIYGDEEKKRTILIQNTKFFGLPIMKILESRLAKELEELRNKIAMAETLIK